MALIPQIFGSLEQYLVTKLMATIAPWAWSGWCNRYPLALFWKFSTNFRSVSHRVSSQANQQASYLALLKLFHFFSEWQGAKSCLKISPPAASVHSISLTTFCHTTSLSFPVFIIPSCNRLKWSNNLEVEFTTKHFLFGKFNTLDDDVPLWSSTHNFCWYGNIADLAPNTDFRRKIKLFSKLLHSIICTLCSWKPVASHFLSQKLVSLRLSAS